MKFKLPELGENIEEAVVVGVAVSSGDTVEAEQTLIEIETDKATLEVPSPVAGTIESIEVKEGDTLKIGQVVAIIEESGESEDEDKKEEAAEEKEADKKKEEREESPEEAKDDEEDEKAEEDEGKDKESKDIEEAEEPKESKAEEEKEPDKEDAGEEGEEEEEPPVTPASRIPVFAVPSIRKLAREIGVDLSEVSGSGPGGKITKEDVKRYARHNLRGTGTPRSATPLASAPLPDFSQWGDVEIEDMSGIRKKTAEHMAQSWASVPHVTLTAKAKASRLEAGVERLRPHVEQSQDAKLTLTAVLVKIAAAALTVFPQFAVSVDMRRKRLIRKRYVHIGVAVDTPGGLLVPVIRDADKKNAGQLAREIQEMAGKAREGKLAASDMRGGVFTVTNLGGLGTGFFTPVVNYPEAAILGIGKIDTEPVFDENRNRFRPGRFLPLSLSFDHRAVDGADGARFLQWVTKAIEDPLLVLVDESNFQSSD